MRVLVLGGTVFLSRAVAVEAVARGHEVICACRGVSGTVPDGARHAALDRDDDVPASLVDLAPDVVVDVSRTPSQVRRAVAAWPDAHWVFVSTVSVYADLATPGDHESTPTHAPQTSDVDLSSSPDAYGAMKVACEQLVQQGTVGSLVVRPGLIVGPGDPSGRFTYWPERLGRAATGGPDEPVLAPGAPEDVVEVLDVRDLAALVVEAAEQGRAGVVDAVGPPTPIGGLLAQVAAGVGAEPRWAWADRAFLEQHEVAPWSGDRSVPLWLPRPEYDGMMHRDDAPARVAGLQCRPVAETARDVLAWLRAEPSAVRTGLTASEEHELLTLCGG